MKSRGQVARRRGGRGRTGANERYAVAVIAGMSGVAALFAPGAPTTTGWFDALARFAVAVAVVSITARARRWTWLVLAGLSAVAAATGATLAIGVVGLAAALVGSFLVRRRVIGAVVAALSIQVLFRLPDMGFVGSSFIYCLIATTPAIISGYHQMGRSDKRMVRRCVAGIGVIVLFGTTLFGIAAMLAWSDANRGVNEAREGLASISDARAADATVLFDRSEASLRSANSVVGSWWAYPAKLVPVLAQQARAVEVVTGEGAALARAARRISTEGDVQELQYSSGRIDVELIAEMREPLADVVGRLGRASGRLDSAASPWLLPQVSDGLSRISREVDRALDQSELASLGVEAVPGLLGGDGPRTYLVLLTQPAEARGLGGFVGSWVELRAEDGRLEVSRSGRARDINETPGRADRSLSGPTDYLDRYGRFRPAYYFQDITFSPDFPSVAQVAREIYPQAGGAELDGVMAVDPTGLAALLELSGPVKLAEYDITLDSASAMEFLTSEQYITFADQDQREAREEVLEAAGRATFDSLVTGSLPSPRRLGAVLGPAVEGRHLMFHSFRADEQALFARLGATGSVEHVGSGDYLAVVTQNKGNNKIDVYMHRSIDYRAVYDPTTGHVNAQATVVLRNDAPSQGLPDSVIGSNDQGLPPGTNELYFSLYTPLRLKGTTLEGESIGVEFQREFGYAVYSRFVEIPPGASRTLSFDLEGDLGVGHDYILDVGSQPIPNPDLMTIRIDAAPGTFITSTSGLGVAGLGAQAVGSVMIDTPRRFSVTFGS